VTDELRRTIDLTIESIAAGGDGVGRLDGLVVFVPRSAPGDRGTVGITVAGRFARGSWQRIDTPGPDRVEPACPHYVADRCGGCQLQHLRYDAQIAAKARIIGDSIERIGRRAAPPARVEPSPGEWRYRRKLTLALRRTPQGGWIMGLHPYDAPGHVFNLRDCPITDERVLDAWNEIRLAAGLLPRAPALRAAVRLLGDDVTPGASLVVEGGNDWQEHERFFDAVPALATLWWQPEGGRRRRLHARAGVAVDDGLARPSAPSARAATPDAGDAARADENLPSATDSSASFVQVNAEMAKHLHAYVVGRVMIHEPATVIDAYAGIGDSAAVLASHGATVVAIELDPESAALAASRLTEPSRAIAGRVEDILPRVLPADVVVLNPPRAGVHESVIARLSAAASVRAIIYVSCNPATLARDLGRLSGYRIASLLGFDMFPQTAHVETVCELVREAA
jgi:23S rRNA (uracil1939-C5)-methyltransferase